MDSERGKLFIGGIPWDADEERLRTYFSTFGDVTDVVIVKDRATGRGRGFGFVGFADPDVADRVLLEKLTMDGRTMEAKKAIPREEQHNLAARNRNNSNTNASYGGGRTKKIFVGGLPSNITEDDFKGYFLQFGPITDVVVIYDQATQRSRGFGFITFESEESVENVVQSAFHEVLGKVVEVKKAVPKELSTPSGRSNYTSFGMASGVGRGVPYGAGSGPGYLSTPSNSYGQNSPVSSGGGGCPTYIPAPGYGGAGGFGMTMNSGYGAPYPSAATYATVYGGGPSPSPYGNGAPYGAPLAPAPGYANASMAPVAPRASWGNAGISFGGPGATAAGYTPSGTGYMLPALPSPPASAQTPINAASYGNGSYGYGALDPTYGSNAVYQPRAPVEGYGNAYMTAAVYGKSDSPQIASSGPTAVDGASVSMCEYGQDPKDGACLFWFSLEPLFFLVQLFTGPTERLFPKRLSGEFLVKIIFVGGLPSNVSEHDFKGGFLQFGPITDVLYMTKLRREVKKAVHKELSSPSGRSSSASFSMTSGVGRWCSIWCRQQSGISIHDSTPVLIWAKCSGCIWWRRLFNLHTCSFFCFWLWWRRTVWNDISMELRTVLPLLMLQVMGMDYLSPLMAMVQHPGYANVSTAFVAPRAPWGNAGIGFGRPGAPAAGYTPSGTGYIHPVWPSPTASPQTPINAASYGNGTYGYGALHPSYGSNTVYQP